MSDLTELRAAALRLPEHDRAVMAAALLESLPMPAYVEEALLDTARSRYNDIANGVVQAVGWEAFAALLQGRRLA